MKCSTSIFSSSWKTRSSSHATNRFCLQARGWIRYLHACLFYNKRTHESFRLLTSFIQTLEEKFSETPKTHARSFGEKSSELSRRCVCAVEFSRADTVSLIVHPSESAGHRKALLISPWWMLKMQIEKARRWTCRVWLFSRRISWLRQRSEFIRGSSRVDLTHSEWCLIQISWKHSLI